MVERIGGSAMAREAMLAALKGASERAGLSGASGAAAPLADGAQSAGAAGAAPTVDFAQALEAGVRQVDAKVQGADALPLDLLSGKVNDFHEIAVQLKSTEISFKFALEIRNKLVDAYREVMRMSV
ncbi:MAG: flagellar hook-basal body complex protein FliE [Planctomycetota bacterium]